MSQILTNPIVTKADIQKYRSIADTLDNTDTLLPYILEAQNVELREFLGDPMFYDLMNEYFDTPVPQMYYDLVDGTTYTYNTYTISYDGLKPLICYWAFARLLNSHGASVVRYGVVQKRLNESEPVDSAVIARMITQARTTAKFYQSQATQFLTTERATYTLWGASASKPRSGGIRLTKVSIDSVKPAAERCCEGGSSTVTSEEANVKYVSTDYTAVKADSTIVVTTGATDKTIRIPTSGTNPNKIYRIIKGDSGAGRVLVTPTRELIDGQSELAIRFQHQVIGLQLGVGQLITITPY